MIKTGVAPGQAVAAGAFDGVEGLVSCPCWISLSVSRIVALGLPHSTRKRQLTARKLQENRMDTDFSRFERVHLWGDSAMRPIAPCSPRHADLQSLHF